MDKEFQFLIDEENNCIQGKKLVCIFNDDGVAEMIQVNDAVLLQMRQTGFNINEALLPQQDNSSVENSEKVNSFHNAILVLSNAYKEHKESLEGGVQSSQFYLKISNTLCEENFIFTPQQCKWKLGKRARKAGNSGGVPINFKYSEEMDDIFGYSHSIGLPVPASSSKYIPMPLEDSDDTHEEGSFVAPITKRRRVTMADTVADFRKESEVRHKEKMNKLETANNLARRQLDLNKQALAEHKELMLKIIEKL